MCGRRLAGILSGLILIGMVGITACMERQVEADQPGEAVESEYDRGKTEAYADLRAGNPRYLRVGPPPSADSRLAVILKEDYGVTLVELGCTGGGEHVRAYNEIVLNAMQERFGRDIIKTAYQKDQEQRKERRNRQKEAIPLARAAVANIQKDILALKPFYPELSEFALTKREDDLSFSYQKDPIAPSDRQKRQTYKTSIGVIFFTSSVHQIIAIELENIGLEYQTASKCRSKELQTKMQEIFDKHLRPVLDLNTQAGTLLQDKNGNFTLYVSNQSFAVDPVDIKVQIDGKIAVDDDFDVGVGKKAQHNWEAFQFSLPQGIHKIKIKSTKGEARLQRDFEIKDKHWAVVDYWYYPESHYSPSPKHFKFNIEDSPIGFE